MKKNDRTSVRIREEERPLPQNVAAEQRLLGCMCLSSECMRLAPDVIPDYFTRAEHVTLLRLITECYRQGAASITPAVIREWMERSDEAPDPVMLDYFAGVAASEPTLWNIGYFRDQVRDSYLRRMSVLAARTIISRAHDEQVSVADFSSRAQEIADALAEAGDSEWPVSISLAEIVSGDMPKPKWTVEDLIPEGGLGIIVGEAGVGKSWLMYHLALCVASGKPYLGRFAVKQSPALMLDAEASLDLIGSRMTRLWNGISGETDSAPPSAMPQDLPVRIIAGAMMLDDPRAMREFERRICEVGAGLAIIDPLVMVHSLDENSSADMAGFFGSLKRLAARTGCTLVIAHHARKQGPVSNRASERIRGSSAIRGAVDCHIFLRRTSAGKMIVEVSKMKAIPEPKPFAVELADVDDGAVTLAYVGDAEESADKTQAALEFILRTLADNGGSLRRKEIETVAALQGIATRTLTRSLKDGTESGQLSKARQGSEVAYSLPAATLDMC